MAITSLEQLQSRALSLIARGEPVNEEAVSIIVNELNEGGALFTVEECSNALRDAYIDPFISVKFLDDIVNRFNLEYNNKN